MLAAWNGRPDCVKTLLQHNPEAQVKALSWKGRTALALAAWEGHVECVGLLLRHSPEAQVAEADEDGRAALMLASENGHAACIELLLQHDPEAQVAAKDQHGTSALGSAVCNNYPDCVALLLAHSPSTQVAADHVGNPITVWAAWLGHTECLDLLLAHDPPPQHLDAAWCSALNEWSPTGGRNSRHAPGLERLLARGALLPVTAQSEEIRAKARLFIQEVGSRALVEDRANEAIVGLAMNARGKKRKADPGT